MSIKNGLLYSLIGFGISGATCSIFLKNFVNKFNSNLLNDGNSENTLVKKKYVSPETICNALVLGTGLVGFFYGYKKNSCCSYYRN